MFHLVWIRIFTELIDQYNSTWQKVGPNSNPSRYFVPTGGTNRFSNTLGVSKNVPTKDMSCNANASTINRKSIISSTLCSEEKNLFRARISLKTKNVKWGTESAQPTSLSIQLTVCPQRQQQSAFALSKTWRTIYRYPAAKENYMSTNTAPRYVPWWEVGPSVCLTESVLPVLLPPTIKTN